MPASSSFNPPPPDDQRSAQGLRRIWRALLHSCRGLRTAIRQERAFRQESALAVILIPLAVSLPLTSAERLLLIGSTLGVLIVELLNSAIEAAVNRISLARHPLSRQAKDFGSAAVLIALSWCGLAWLALAGPLLVEWLGQTFK